jgi:hypothetical protein
VSRLRNYPLGPSTEKGAWVGSKAGIISALPGSALLEPLYDEQDRSGIRPQVRGELIPLGVCERRKADLYVADHVKDCACFLGALDRHGQFIPHGTGFFVGMAAFNFGIFYIVTAKHVIDQIGGDVVVARINTKDGGCTFEAFPKGKWHFHPDHREEGRKPNYIDVAACHVNVGWTNWEFVYISEDDYCTDKVIERYTIDTAYWQYCCHARRTSSYQQGLYGCLFD